MNFIHQHIEIFLYGVIKFTVFAYIYGFISEKKESFSLNKELKNIDKMNGYDFEKYIEVLCISLGYKVLRTQDSKDYGADLIISKRGKRIAVQTKRYKSNVGLKAVQEVVASKAMYGCNEAMVITNSFYTKPAMELAKKNNVTLWNREDLIKQIIHTKPSKLNKKQKRLTYA